MQTVRSLIGSADPAHEVTVPAPPMSAADLIAHAESRPDPAPALVRPARTARRLVLARGATVAAAVAVVIGVSAALVTGPDAPGTQDPTQSLEYGPVLTPIAYEIDEDAPPAGEYLRALAASLVDAPYEQHQGEYAYHHVRTYGDPVLGSPDGEYLMGLVTEIETWVRADGNGRQLTSTIGVEFPDQASRDYFVTQDPLPLNEPHEVSPPPVPIEPLPTDRAGIAELLKVQHGGPAVPKQVMRAYTTYVVPTGTRAEILQVLADVPGLLWRGEVTDRAGRAGVAITLDDPGQNQQHLMVFDPNTGALLAVELVTTTEERRVSSYLLLLDTDWRIGIG